MAEQTREQLRTSGRNAQADAVHQFELLAGLEMGTISRLYPHLLGQIEQMFYQLGPEGIDAEVKAYRNSQYQNATQAGQTGANLARWSGLGSGSQEAAMLDSVQEGQNNASQMEMDARSPEGLLRRLSARASLLQPQVLPQSLQYTQQLRGAQPPKPKSPGLFGQLLGIGGQLFGAGVFNRQQEPSTQQQQPAQQNQGFGAPTFGSSWQLPVRY